MCPVDVSLRWMTEVASSIYATPVIADLFSDGQKEVVVPTFVHFLEVVEVRLSGLCRSGKQMNFSQCVAGGACFK